MSIAVERRAPDMDFDDAELHERREAVEISDREKLLAVLRIGCTDDRLVHSLGRMLLEEALPVDAIRRTHQAERPVDHETLDARPDLFIVVEQGLLGDAGFRPQQFVGTAQGHGHGFGSVHRSSKRTWRHAQVRRDFVGIIRQIAGFGNGIFAGCKIALGPTMPVPAASFPRAAARAFPNSRIWLMLVTVRSNGRTCHDCIDDAELRSQGKGRAGHRRLARHRPRHMRSPAPVPAPT